MCTRQLKLKDSAVTGSNFWFVGLVFKTLLEMSMLFDVTSSLNGVILLELTCDGYLSMINGLGALSLLWFICDKIIIDTWIWILSGRMLPHKKVNSGFQAAFCLSWPLLLLLFKSEFSLLSTRGLCLDELSFKVSLALLKIFVVQLGTYILGFF